MSGLTPGPWELHEPTTPSAAWWIWGNHSGPDAWHVVGTANSELDARLFAAAPDLLQACEEALARFELEPDIPAPRSLLRRAIAKARRQAVAS